MYIRTSPEFTALLERAAARQGSTLDAYVKALIDMHCIKLMHIERCMPKPKEPAKSVGRPALSAEDKGIRDLASFLNTVYGKLKALHGADYEARFGEQERQYLQLVENKDLSALSAFAKDQPWQKRR